MEESFFSFFPRLLLVFGIGVIIGLFLQDFSVIFISIFYSFARFLFLLLYFILQQSKNRNVKGCRKIVADEKRLDFYYYVLCFIFQFIPLVQSKSNSKDCTKDNGGWKRKMIGSTKRFFLQYFIVFLLARFLFLPLYSTFRYFFSTRSAKIPVYERQWWIVSIKKFVLDFYPCYYISPSNIIF